VKGIQIIALILLSFLLTINKEEALPQNPILSIYRPSYILVESGDADSLQSAINAVAENGVVQINGNLPTFISKSIVIKRDNVWLKGDGGLLQLKPQANEPVVILGHTEEHPAQTSGIRLSGFFIDGNRECQQSEFSQTSPYLRNNGVSVRNVSGAEIFDLTVHSCASGGIVLEKGCEKAFVHNIETYAHEWDGVAACETTKSKFYHIHSHHNKAAFSFDWFFNDNFIGKSITNDCHMSVFIRNSNRNYFDIYSIRMSKFPVLVAEYGNDPKTAANFNYFKIETLDCAAKSIILDVSCNDNVIMEDGKFVYGFF
jgi:hypothetical protein